MPNRLHPLLIDDLVLGQDDAGSPAWDALVTSPSASQDWAEGVARRAALDELASLIRERPWLARLLLSVRRGRRSWSAPTDHAFVFGPPALQALLDGEARTPIAWGTDSVRELVIGERISIQRDEHVRLFFQTTTGGREFAGDWVLEEGDAPVAIVAVLDPDSAVADLQQALGSDRPKAVLVLLEKSEKTE